MHVSPGSWVHAAVQPASFYLCGGGMSWGYFTVGTDEGCMSGCNWAGTSQCTRCGNRLRCACGAYVREDNLPAHIETCRAVNDECDCVAARGYTLHNCRYCSGSGARSGTTALEGKKP